MARLSDRAFKVIELEINNLHNQGVIDKLDSIILVARLQTLQAESGKHLTRIQIWNHLCDVIPEIDPKVLTSAAANGENLSDIRISAGVGATAVLVASMFGMGSTTASTSTPILPSQMSQGAAKGTDKSAVKSAAKAENQVESRAQNPISQPLSLKARFTRASAGASESTALIQAKQLGWQAALRGQNPPHSAQHWQETAALWQQAIVYLHQVPKRYADYAAVEAKIAFYQRNLAEVEGRRMAAIAQERSAQLSKPEPSVQTNAPHFSTTDMDHLAIARRYGWQAALASQKAPFPAQKWADISRGWKTALHHLEQVPIDSPQYTEAQQVKITYQQNLAAVQQRYRQEQVASQSVASLQAALDEIEQSGLSRQTKERQNQAILTRLRAIPAGTDAYLQAQSAISQINSSEIRPTKTIAASYR